MKKNYLYTALGLMGIMGTLSIGVTSADTSCWDGLGTVPTSTYASGIVYGCDGDIPVISIERDGKGITIKAMNEGSVKIGSGRDTTSYGGLYQWGNNYSFPNVADTTTSIDSGTFAVNASNYLNASGYYESGTWIKQGKWDSSDNRNLWGGSGDEKNGWWGFNTGDFTVYNSESRKAMCPDGYHIPSIGEWNTLVFYLWGYNYDAKQKTSLFTYRSSNLNSFGYSESGGKRFSQDMMMPFVRSRKINNNVNQGYNYGKYWSSSPYDENKAMGYHVEDSYLSKSTEEYGYGSAVRCFKNSYMELPQTFTLTFDANTNGGITTTGSVEVDGSVDLSGYIAIKTGWDFLGWNTNSGATAPISTSYNAYTITENTTVYAIFKKDLKVTYLTGVGVASIGADSGSCAIYNTGTQCTVVAPGITLKAGYGTGKWSTGSINVNTGADITLTENDTYTASATPNTDTQYLVDYYQENLNGSYGLYETWTGHGITDTQAVVTGTDKSYDGFIFSGTHASNVTSGNIDGDGNRRLSLYYDRVEYKVTFDSNSGSTVDPITAKYQSGIRLPEPTRTGYTFKGWGDAFLSGDYTVTDNITLTGKWEANTYTVKFDAGGGTGTMEDQTFTYDVAQDLTGNTFTREGYTFSGWTDGTTGYTNKQSVINLTGTNGGIINLTAQWTQNPPSGGSSSGGGGGGGGGGGSTKTTTTKTTTGTVTTGTNETNVKSDTQDEENQEDEDEGETQEDKDEFQRAYEFAYKHGITTMPTIEQANMTGTLTRIAMAKMLSYYAINVLGLKPDETRVNKFNDVSEKLDAEYNNGVTLAYQLGIMGINMPKNNFRPNDLVTRGEFATALSRMLYGIEDGKDKYYSTHLAKLMEEKIITNDDPKMKELRGYVMIMLMRSAENKSTGN